MPSPWVRRALEEGRKTDHKATRRVEPTLADRIPADAEHPRRDASGLPICSRKCRCT